MNKKTKVLIGTALCSAVVAAVVCFLTKLNDTDEDDIWDEDEFLDYEDDILDEDIYAED
jgi:hypothetical protein